MTVPSWNCFVFVYMSKNAPLVLLQGLASHMISLVTRWIFGYIFVHSNGMVSISSTHLILWSFVSNKVQSPYMSGSEVRTWD